MKIISARCVR